MGVTSQQELSPSSFFLGLFYALSIKGFYRLYTSGVRGRGTIDTFIRTADFVSELGKRYHLRVNDVLRSLTPHPIYHTIKAFDETLTCAHLGSLVYFRSDKSDSYFINEKSCFPEHYSPDECQFYLEVADHFIENFRLLVEIDS